MTKGSKWSDETRAKIKDARSPNGACKRGHARTPENTGVRGYCRLCKNMIANLRNQNHPIQASEKTRKDNRVKSAKISERIKEYKKTHPCVDCGEADIVVLVFDHRDRDTKKFRVRSARSWVQLEAEIAKCDVRCCNCHARRHAAHGWKFGEN